MWRFAALILFFLIIVLTGHRDRVREALSSLSGAVATALQSEVARVRAFLVHATGRFRGRQELVSWESPDLFLANGIGDLAGSGTFSKVEVFPCLLEGITHTRGATVASAVWTPAPDPASLPAMVTAALWDGESQVPDPVVASPDLRRGEKNPKSEGSPATDGLTVKGLTVAEMTVKGLTIRGEAGHIPASARADEIGDDVLAIPPLRLAALVKAELVRLRCYDGPSDNVWDAAAGRAVRRVNRLTGLRLRTVDPAVATLETLQGLAGPLCDGSRRRTGDGASRLAKRQDRLPGEFPMTAASPAGVGASVRGRDRPASGAGPSVPDDGSYLPPWMRAARLAEAGSTEADKSDGAGELAGRAETGEAEPSARRSGASRAHAARHHREWRPRRRRQAPRSSGSWFPFLFD